MNILCLCGLDTGLNCTDLDNVANAEVTYGNRQFEGEATYTCNYGYFIDGQDEQTTVQQLSCSFDQAAAKVHWSPKRTSCSGMYPMLCA